MVFILSAVIMISGLLMISYFSIFGLHAKPFSVLPKPDIFDCELQSISENTLEQFRTNAKKVITSTGDWLWVEQTKDMKGCSYLKRMYKTEIFGDKND